MHKSDALILFSNSFINCARFHPLLDSFEGHQSMLRGGEEVHICLTLENRAGGGYAWALQILTSYIHQNSTIP